MLVLAVRELSGQCLTLSSGRRPGLRRHMGSLVGGTRASVRGLHNWPLPSIQHLQNPPPPPIGGPNILAIHPLPIPRWPVSTHRHEPNSPPPRTSYPARTVDDSISHALHVLPHNLGKMAPLMEPAHIRIVVRAIDSAHVEPPQASNLNRCGAFRGSYGSQGSL